MNTPPAVKMLWAAGLLATLAACGARGPQVPEPPPAPIGPGNSLVMPNIVYGTTNEGLRLTAEDDKCDIPGTMRAAFQDNLAEPYLNLLTEAPANVVGIPVLKVEIIDILANAGGIYGGPKIVEIKGTLEKNGKTVASFKARRRSFPLFGIPRSTCNIVGRDTYALGTDMTTWLAKPVDGAMLGDY